MRDHNYITGGGQRVPVSQMATADIEDALRDGFSVDNSDGYFDSAYWIRQRLLLELDIRRMGLR